MFGHSHAESANERRDEEWLGLPAPSTLLRLWAAGSVTSVKLVEIRDCGSRRPDAVAPVEGCLQSVRLRTAIDGMADWAEGAWCGCGRTPPHPTPCRPRRPRPAPPAPRALHPAPAVLASMPSTPQWIA